MTAPPSLTVLRAGGHGQMGRPEGRYGVDEHFLDRLALWLADVAAEAALAIETQDAVSGLLDAKPEQVPAAVVSP